MRSLIVADEMVADGVAGALCRAVFQQLTYYVATVCPFPRNFLLLRATLPAFPPVMDSFQVGTDLHENAENREGYFAYTTDNVPFSSVSIRNDNSTDYGNALIVDELRWSHYEVPRTILASAPRVCLSPNGETRRISMLWHVMPVPDA